MDRKSISALMICAAALLAFTACGGGGGGGGSDTPDTQAPSTPAGLISSPVSTSQISLTWSASSDDRGVAGYRVYRLVTQPAVTVETSVSVAARTFDDIGLLESSHRCYQVSAYDAAGNESARSAVACNTTMMGSYTLPSTGESITSLPTPTLQNADTAHPLSYTTVTGAASSVISYPAYTIVNSAVTDSWTSLAWQQESDNRPRTWDEAQAYCNDLALADQTDWRLPSRKELMSIIHYGMTTPAMDAIFMMAPGTSPPEYWTASSYPSSLTGGANAWTVDFTDGTLNYRLKTSSHFVRCVRGGRLPLQAYSIFASGTDTVVVDSSTGLTWQRLASSTSATWGDALTTCETSTIGNLTWRLPTIRELETLVDDRINAPVIDRTNFTDSLPTLNRVYWSATTINSNTGKAWGIYFYNGQVPTVNMEKNNLQGGAVRCVR